MNRRFFCRFVLRRSVLRRSVLRRTIVQRAIVAAALATLCLGSAGHSAEPASPDVVIDASSDLWLTSYREATTRAKKKQCLAFLWFCDPEDKAGNAAWESVLAEQPEIAERLRKDFVPARIPLTTLRETDEDAGEANRGEANTGEADAAEADASASPARIVDHPAFAELRGGAGLAIVDYRDEASPHYGMVVSIYPFAEGRLSAGDLAVLVDLPAGSLTSRTLVFALRTHRDRPQSTSTGDHPVLVQEAARHAAHQARIRLQGHHGWEHRFHAINARLPAGHVANEVCAESWPGQTLIAAARECVSSWRQSPGHWNHVSQPAAYYGYDMQRSASGTWYAAGIVAHRR
jgi:hypothetical protein